MSFYGHDYPEPSDPGPDDNPTIQPPADDGWTPPDDERDAELERQIIFNQKVYAAAEQLRVREAARVRVAAEKAGDVTIPTLVRLDEFLERPLDPITHRIEGLWPVGGRVLLAAQWKAGKTTLRDNVIRSLVDGHTFLGVHHTAPIDGSVVLLDFELDEQTLQRWLDDQGFRHPERVHVLSMKGRVSTFDILDEQLRARWAQVLSAAGPAVLMIDCLRPIMDALALEENHDGGRLLVAIDELAEQAGIREVFVVHHMGHGAERSRGDSRFRDWPDAEWRLVRDKDDDDPTMDNPQGARYFSAFGRDVDHAQAELTFDPETRHLTLGADATNRREAGERRKLEKAGEAILQVIARQPGINKRSLRNACRKLGAAHNPDIDAAVDHLESEGQIIVLRQGQSHLHYLSDPNVPNVPNRAPGTPGTTVPRALYRGTVTVPLLEADQTDPEVGHGHADEPTCPDCSRRLSRSEVADGLCIQCRRIRNAQEAS